MDANPQTRAAAELLDYWSPLLLRLSVDAGVIEAFGRDDRTAEEVAATTGTNADAVARIVRALASRGLFDEAGDGRYHLTELGRRFLADEPGSMAGMANFKPYELHAWAEAGHTLRTGEASFPTYFEEDLWEWLAANPTLVAKFNDDMRRRTTMLLTTAMPLFDWPQTGTVVDVGGGNGLLMEMLMAQQPGLRGVVFDLPHVVAEAEKRLTDAGLMVRVSTVGGDFFQAVPEGGDMYVMASVLHDWNDDEGARILGSVRRAIVPDGRLVLFESVLRPGTEFDLGKMVDLHMLVLFGSRERTREEWEALLARGGFTLERVVPTPGLAWIEARPTG